jgi:DNA-binding protein HU-beta
MNRQGLIDHIANEAGISKKDAGAALNAALDGIRDTLAGGESVALTGFGTFEVRSRKEREGVKPGTTEKITIPAAKVPAFKAGKGLKDAVK